MANHKIDACVNIGSYGSKNVTVLYKDRRYRLLWAGRTHFGHKAKLTFGSEGSHAFGERKEFWVRLDSISDPLESTMPPEPDRIDCPNADMGEILIPNAPPAEKSKKR